MRERWGKGQFIAEGKILMDGVLMERVVDWDGVPRL